jgi:hypothetical protein
MSAHKIGVKKGAKIKASWYKTSEHRIRKAVESTCGDICTVWITLSVVPHLLINIRLRCSGSRSTREYQSSPIFSNLLHCDYDEAGVIGRKRSEV